ncbi:hypothetical protein EON66_07795 [archaeon]|nr:MAG: hypothetical protein EON66_07795 [archaeon]
MLVKTLMSLEQAVQTLTPEALRAYPGSYAMEDGSLVLPVLQFYRLMASANVSFETAPTICSMLDVLIDQMAADAGSALQLPTGSSLRAMGVVSKSGGGGVADAGVVAALEFFRDTLTRLFRNRAELLTLGDDYQVVLYVPQASSASTMFSSLRTAVRGRTIGFWCLSPSAAMDDIRRLNVRSIILASGTLSPLASYAAELRLPFPVRLENPHIISNEQVMAAVVRTGMRGESLRSSFERRSDAKYLEDLGYTIAHLLRHIPDGVLVFFPSYTVMDTCVGSWRNMAQGNIIRLMHDAKVRAHANDALPCAHVCTSACEFVRL